jgi:hypothetical protein
MVDVILRRISFTMNNKKDGNRDEKGEKVEKKQKEKGEEVE